MDGKYSSVFLIIGIVLVLFSIGLFTAALYPFNPLELKSPLGIISQSKIIQQGDCVFVSMHYVQNAWGSAVVTAQAIMEDNTNIASMLLGLNLEPGENKIIVGFMLPRNINLLSNKKTLTAKLKISFQYKVWGIRTIDVSFYTDNFKILLDKNI